MFYLFVTITLGLFWIVLSGHFSPLLLSFGAASVLLVVWFVRRMDQADLQPATFIPGLRMIGYISWLLGCVIRANIDLAKRIWQPRLPIQPVWARLDTTVTTPLQKSLYANSITLTPGTLTTDVHEDHLMIHSLTPEGIDELRQGEMERRIHRLGI